jgi:cob(I)alamin adenosyltransferase
MRILQRYQSQNVVQFKALPKPVQFVVRGRFAWAAALLMAEAFARAADRTAFVCRLFIASF